MNPIKEKESYPALRQTKLEKENDSTKELKIRTKNGIRAQATLSYKYYLLKVDRTETVTDRKKQ